MFSKKSFTISLFISSIFASCSPIAFAETMAFNGEVKVVTPEFQVVVERFSEGELVKDYQDYRLKTKKIGDSLNILPVRMEQSIDEEIGTTAFLRLRALPDGLRESGYVFTESNAVKGVDSSVLPEINGPFLQEGQNTIAYDIVVYSGSSKEERVIGSFSKMLNVQEVAPPEIKGIVSLMDRSQHERSGYSPTVYSKEDDVQEITVEVEPTLYDQRVRFNVRNLPEVEVSLDNAKMFTECTVAAGENKCVLSMDTLESADFDTLEKQAKRNNEVFNPIQVSQNYLISLNSANDQPDKSRIPHELFKVNGDFRAPEIVDIIAPEQAKDGLTADKDEVIVIVRTPHPEFVQNDSPEVSWARPKGSSHIKLDGLPIENYGDAINDSPVPISELYNEVGYGISGSLIKIDGDKIYYRMSVAHWEDGGWLISPEVRDGFNNEKFNPPLAKDFNRNEITIEMVNKFSDVKVIDGTEIGFTSDFNVTVKDGHRAPIALKSAMLGGENVEVVETLFSAPYYDKATNKYITPNPQIDYVKGFNYRLGDGVQNVETGVVQPLVFVAGETGNNSNDVTKTLNVGYMYNDFALIGMPQNPKQGIFDYKGEIEYKHGIRCVWLENQSEAEKVSALYAEKGKSSCYVNWTTLPDGLSASMTDVSGRFINLGKQRLAFEIVGYGGSGQSSVIDRGVFDFDVTLPGSPYLKYRSSMKLSEDKSKYLLEYDSGFLGSVESNAVDPTFYKLEFHGVDIENIEGETTLVNGNARLFKPLFMPNMPVWGEGKVDVSVGFKNAPDSVTQETISVIRVPEYRKIRLENIDAKRSVLNDGELQVSIKIGQPNFQNEGKLEYDFNRHGEWEISLNKLAPGGVFVPISQAKLNDSSGVAEFSLPTDGNPRITYIPIAKIKAPGNVVEKTLIGRATSVTVLNAFPVKASLSGKLEGSVPFNAFIRLNAASRLDLQSLDVDSIEWQASADQTNWSDAQGKIFASSASLSFDKAGTYFVRAKVKNKNSGIASFTDTIKIVAFESPNVILKADNRVFVNETVTASVEAAGGQPEIITELSLDRGKTWVKQDSIELTSDVRKTFIVMSRSRFAYAPEGNPRSWKRFLVPVTFNDYASPNISGTGPRLIEAGKEYEFNFKISSPFRGLKADSIGEVVFPDGSKKQLYAGENTIKYTVAPEHTVKGKMMVSVHAWIDGFKEKTLKSRDFQYRTWVYDWPDFKIIGKTNYDQVPAVGTFHISPSPSLVRYLEGLKFEWRIPQGVETLYSKDHYKRLQFNQAGESRIEVMVTDDRGHSSVLSKVLTLDKTVQPNIEIQDKNGANGSNEPAKALFSSRVKLGHVQDRIESVQWMLNGEPLPEFSGKTIVLLEDLVSGNYTLTNKVSTYLGGEMSESHGFTIKDNELPTCTVSIKQISDSSFDASLYCKDSDGYVSSYKWFDDSYSQDIPLSRGRRIQGQYDSEGFIPDLRIVVTDNSNESNIYYLRALAKQ